MVRNCKLNICIQWLITWVVIGCGQSNESGAKMRHQPLRDVDKSTLITMIEHLHRSLDVKDYAVNKGIDALKPYLSKYKVCIPGFSAMVPYNNSYLYIYCIYDSKETPPRILSFRFDIPNRLTKQLTLNDIRKPFKTWQLTTRHSSDSTTTNAYHAGTNNVSINLTQRRLPNQEDSIVTEVVVYR
ncbi:hypothetical protein ABDD95_00965 [Mucilaginibacter sp. PAMB04274]|uniref:hypothetical protein n=1 Tax=Mucilaginibacter sp. PAMB04274 TaxID=3138568 RepID=UPI0031F6E2EE